jgi:hypothetical protein
MRIVPTTETFALLVYTVFSSLSTCLRVLQLRLKADDVKLPSACCKAGPFRYLRVPQARAWEGEGEELGSDMEGEEEGEGEEAFSF